MGSHGLGSGSRGLGSGSHGLRSGSHGLGLGSHGLESGSLELGLGSHCLGVHSRLEVVGHETSGDDIIWPGGEGGEKGGTAFSLGGREGIILTGGASDDDL